MMTLLTRTKPFAAASLVGSALLLQGLSASAEDGRKLDPASDKAYEHVIKPILAATCTGCHGEKKDKGKIRLHNPDAIRDADVIIEGQSADSELSNRILLPADDEDVMPPEGKKQLTEEQKKLINWWIDQGADYEKTVGELEAPEDIKVILTAFTVGPVEKAAPKIDLPPAAPQAALDAISGTGVLIMQLAQDNTFLTANTVNVAKTFDDAGVKTLIPVAPQLAWLDVSKTQITDASLADIAQLPNLTRLHLEKTAITDAALPQIAKLGKLEYLNLYGTKVSDAGIAQLKELKNLKKLFVWQTGVTDKGAADLQSALPDCDINMGWKEPAKEEAAPEQAATDEKKPGLYPQLIAICKKDGCCGKAHAEGKTCDHDCCIKAFAANEVCLKCNPESKDALAKLQESLKQ
jgi:hypothetical protein